MYEIGVSDDGTFVGLTKDELEESLNNLRAMAASLGCKVEVVRMVEVGDCEWQEVAEGTESSNGLQQPRITKATRLSSSSMGALRHQAQLYVAEALVTPDLSSRRHMPQLDQVDSRYDTPPPTATGVENDDIDEPYMAQEITEELRVTFTGPTTSGKSSLLGTLSTATLDNGRGKSRLSLLKHRHEIASGVTSSVTQELLGYKSDMVVNYSSGNVSSWTDIHASSEDGRLVFVSDSAGHPRYRRTTVRGLIGWAPHWTFLCIAADDGQNASSNVGGTSSAQEILGTAGAGVDLAKAHLELCLKLEQPLVIIITKLDLASMTRLKQLLSKILSAIKATGRTPSMIAPGADKQVLESELATISNADNASVQKTLSLLKEADTLNSVVPIILTSSASGKGIRQLHALLQSLPIPPPTSQDYTGHVLNPEQPACVFHIEDVFDLAASHHPLGLDTQQPGVVVSGHVRFGRLAIGDLIVIGPFPAHESQSDSPPHKVSLPTRLGDVLLQPSTTDLAGIASREPASVAKGQWHNARIASIRNLRLATKTLEAGQVGTLGLVFEKLDDLTRLSVPRVRKGMVVAIPTKHMQETDHSLQAASGFTARFEDPDINSVTPGSLVVIYIASVRATARVLRLTPSHPQNFSPIPDDLDEIDIFEDNRDEDEDEEDDPPAIFGSYGATNVTLELLTNREWIELGSQVLVMPGGGVGLYSGSERGEKGVAGLEGFVGKVEEVVD